MSWRAALCVEFPSGGRLQIGRISFDEHGVHSGSEPPGSCQLRYTAVANSHAGFPAPRGAGYRKDLGTEGLQERAESVLVTGLGTVAVASAEDSRHQSRELGLRV